MLSARRTPAPLLVLAAALLVALTACSDDTKVDAGPTTAPADTSEADELIAAAVDAVLSEDGSFRSRVTGRVPFVGATTATFEHAGDDILEISDSGGMASATVLVGDTAHEWDISTRSWRETPLDSYDPLMGPGTTFWLALMGLFEAPDDLDAMGAAGALEVATGWTEVDGGADGVRRFERPFPTELMTGSDGPAADAPVERHEEDAVLDEFYRHATATTIVELDADGRFSRYVLRVVFDGSPDFPDCAPMARFERTTEQIVEFSDVGVDFAIEVPDPEELGAQHPSLGEARDVGAEDHLGGIGSEFLDETGERDLTGCPTP